MEESSFWQRGRTWSCKESVKKSWYTNKLRKFLTDKKFKQIVDAVFISKLIYGITVWGFSLNKKELRKLQVLYNKCLRLISHSSYDTPRTELLKKCNRLSVNQLISYHTACQTHRIYRSKLPVYHYRRLFSSPVDPQEPTNITANEIVYNLALSRGHFFYQASHLWNSLPVRIREIDKTRTFKKHLKLWVSQNVKPFE